MRWVSIGGYKGRVGIGGKSGFGGRVWRHGIERDLVLVCLMEMRSEWFINWAIVWPTCMDGPDMYCILYMLTVEDMALGFFFFFFFNCNFYYRPA